MIEHIDITGVRFEVDEITRKYVQKKIGRLDRFFPRHARKSLKIEAVLEEVNRANGNKYQCDIIITAPGKSMKASDSTMNMLAAIDIVEAKLIQQIRKYKETNQPVKGWRAKVARIRQRIG